MMQNLKLPRTLSYGQTFLIHKRCLNYKPEEIVIASAARTPWGKYQGQLASVSALQLGQLAVEAAVKQSAIPLEQIRHIFMNESPQVPKKQENEFIFSDFLKKAQYHAMTVGDKDEPKLEVLIKALEALKSEKNSAVVVAGCQSISQNVAYKQISTAIYPELFPEVSSNDIENYISRNLINYVKSQAEGLFDSEMLTLNVKQLEGKRRIIKEINQDEIFPENCRDDQRTYQYSDGASALVLTSRANAQTLNLNGLAIIKSYEYLKETSKLLSSARKCVDNLLNKTQLEAKQINLWEIEDSIPQLVIYLKHHLNIKCEKMNTHGGSLILGHSAAASLQRLITHLAHSLKVHEYGCVVSTNSQESLALIIQKLPSLSTPQSLPLITLYTKDPCPLCDTVVEELELNFPGEYDLKKVFIDTKENLRFLRLYRLDIPVLFLNNQFLCMHRLNHRLLRQKLDLLK